ncbi:glycoside hydrolase [Mycobacterium sp. IS-1496]|uniref:C40 family peptidase n=1 Tax=Mycobacterium sp. IS-1496 TaxID=1772284 RepID=UPI0007417FD7|nr:C40 family peptidase [Mycobacterium sp. IS-1496]KUI36573.1 glycoside hydrolase [Mycobacterium sp. IS-1496]
MPGTLVDALSAPLREVRNLVGPGWPDGSGGPPGAALAGVRDALTGVATTARTSWQRTGENWSGTAADGAGAFAAATTTAVTELADRTGRLTAGTREAGAAVARAAARLQDIVERFESRAAALEHHLDTPGVAEELLTEARRALREAVAVVEELRAELDSHAGALSAPGAAPAAPPVPTVPAGFGGGAPGGLGTATPMGSLASMASRASGAAPAEAAMPVEAASRRAAAAQPDPGVFGDGVAVRLPDGSTATAPNAVAADAVRHALTQLGVPYQWGGTTPGVGLDCSGLTQWAYGEAGLDLPRLAQEQDVGAAVDAGSLRPGDLAVWDGHVAMVVGDGVMVEAGDPVKLSPIRTSNAGQGFQGFWRPTA